MPRPSERIAIVTTRERAEALSRLMANQYLGYAKDDGKVRELLADADRALKETADVSPVS